MPYAKEKQKIYQRMRYLTDKKKIPVATAVKMMREHELFGGSERPMNKEELIVKFGKAKLGIFTNDRTQQIRVKEKKMDLLKDLYELETEEYVREKITKFLEFYEEQDEEEKSDDEE